jgi:hypothetical protein
MNESQFEKCESINEGQAPNVLPAVEQDIKDEEDYVRLCAGILHGAEAWLLILIERDQLAVQCCADWHGVLESGEDCGKLVGELFAVPRKQMNTTAVVNGLSSVPIKFQFVDPSGAVRKTINRQALHRWGERNVDIGDRFHPGVLDGPCLVGVGRDA